MRDTAEVCATLSGVPWPEVALPATDGSAVNLSDVSGVSVIYAYPRTSPPNAPPIDGWDQIVGARGCTPQTCGFRDHHAELIAAGADRVFGLSSQTTQYQQEVAGRLHLPFALLSDHKLSLVDALGLEVFEAGGMILFRRITLILRDGHVEHVFYPVKNPEQNAVDVLAYLARL